MFDETKDWQAAGIELDSPVEAPATLTANCARAAYVLVTLPLFIIGGVAAVIVSGLVSGWTGTLGTLADLFE